MTPNQSTTIRDLVALGVRRDRAAKIAQDCARRDRRAAKAKQPKRGRSTLETQFLAAWRAVAGRPEPLEEYRFAAPQRRWRFDFAWPACLVAVEIEGGQWSGGRHTRGKGFAADCEKYNAASLAGWRVLRYTTADIRGRLADVVAEVAQAVVAGSTRPLSATDVFQEACGKQTRLVAARAAGGSDGAR